MKRLVFLLFLLGTTAVAQDYNVPFRPRAAAASNVPSQVGTSQTFSIGTGASGNASTTITVPSGTTFVIVGVTGYDSTANRFSAGGLTFTKGASQVAMTSAITGANGGDNSTSAFMAALFYLVAPDVGANKTLAWNWGAGVANSVQLSVTFWKDVNQTTPVRGAGGKQDGTSICGAGATSTITCGTGSAPADLIVAWLASSVGTEGTTSGWTNVTLTEEITAASGADGAWATGTSTANTTVACTGDSLMDDGGLIGICLEPI